MELLVQWKIFLFQKKYKNSSDGKIMSRLLSGVVKRKDGIMIWASMDINEKVELSAYSPHWIALFQSERAYLQNSITNYRPVIEHIGSTAIPEMYAKPVVDIMVGLKEYPIADDIIEIMLSHGYRHHGEAGVTGRTYFTKRQEKGNFNAHITLLGGVVWNDNLLLRDYLINHREVAESYSKLKQKIIESGADTLLEYSEKKSNFILRMIEEARIDSCFK